MAHRPAYVEVVYEWDENQFGKVPLISFARKATAKEIKECEASHRKGKCRHTVFYDEGGWMYDERKCAVCNAFLAWI